MYNDIATAYQKLLDRAVLSVSQGKTTFDDEMYRIVKELASSGIKTIDYMSGRSYRLDSAVKMALKGGITNMHMELQQEFGKQFDVDGVEVSVHSNPAPDHMYVQGKQFSINKYDEDGNLITKGEFEKFQDDEDAVSYDGTKFPKDSEETGHDRRSIGQYNCYHYIFAVILGVSKPAYSNEELQKIIDKGNKGFVFEKKKYNMYEGEQLQRSIELQLRKLKDEQIMARASNMGEKAELAQEKINKWTKRYNNLLKASGLPSKIERARVPGYHYIKVANEKIK